MARRAAVRCMAWRCGKYVDQHAGNSVAAMQARTVPCHSHVTRRGTLVNAPRAMALGLF
jgi:hypothetical protein